MEKIIVKCSVSHIKEERYLLIAKQFDRTHLLSCDARSVTVIIRHIYISCPDVPHCVSVFLRAIFSCGVPSLCWVTFRTILRHRLRCATFPRAIISRIVPSVSFVTYRSDIHQSLFLCHIACLYSLRLHVLKLCNRSSPPITFKM